MDFYEEPDGYHHPKGHYSNDCVSRARPQSRIFAVINMKGTNLISFQMDIYQEVSMYHNYQYSKIGRYYDCSFFLAGVGNKEELKNEAWQQTIGNPNTTLFNWVNNNCVTIVCYQRLWQHILVTINSPLADVIKKQMGRFCKNNLFVSNMYFMFVLPKTSLTLIWCALLQNVRDVAAYLKG